MLVATAILDRLLYHSHVITLRGDAYRLKEKKRSGLYNPPVAEKLISGHVSADGTLVRANAS